jgi:hypothetical protein
MLATKLFVHRSTLTLLQSQRRKDTKNSAYQDTDYVFKSYPGMLIADSFKRPVALLRGRSHLYKRGHWINWCSLTSSVSS